MAPYKPQTVDRAIGPSVSRPASHRTNLRSFVAMPGGRVTVSVTKPDETGPCPVKSGKPAAVSAHIKLAHNPSGRRFKSSPLPGETAPERILYGAVSVASNLPALISEAPHPALIIATLRRPKLSSSPAFSSAEQDLGPWPVGRSVLARDGRSVQLGLRAPCSSWNATRREMTRPRAGPPGETAVKQGPCEYGYRIPGRTPP